MSKFLYIETTKLGSEETSNSNLVESSVISRGGGSRDSRPDITSKTKTEQPSALLKPDILLKCSRLQLKDDDSLEYYSEKNWKENRKKRNETVHVKFLIFRRSHKFKLDLSFPFLIGSFNLIL